ncbi:MAG TPA: hypothetical protein PK186_05665 [candidate division Zixibacteria bacterium]|nr:hypothetical protein [candidate division Zixibacteria bacterium]MDD4918758.1 hypothetical protein [candidate division Zixibacteria bacterium]MDM7974287.1 hypothetical protein [candidate division Zixibacteria bacterium]HOD67435.1 hypothetical protein [candidate division Zixibacteria bacterium]HPM37027.1 hypothetical protein [candidate division Zixibacteria bacterium]
MPRYLPVIASACCFLLMLPAQSSGQEDCSADFDVDGDGQPLSINDFVTAVRALAGDTTVAVAWSHLDLNGDCRIDGADLELAACYFESGLACFPDGFPVPTCCQPDTVRGACCLPPDSCSVRHPANCAQLGGIYMGDWSACAAYLCDCCEGVRDDINGDGAFKVADATFFIAFLFRGGLEPPCFEEADLNADGKLDINDLVGSLIPALFHPGTWMWLPCPGADLPADITFEVRWYDTPTGGLSRMDTLYLTLLGPGALHGTFEPGVPEDSVAGTWYADGSLYLANAIGLADAGFVTRQYRSGDTWAGIWEFTTIAGPRRLPGTMRPLPSI